MNTLRDAKTLLAVTSILGALVVTAACSSSTGTETTPAATSAVTGTVQGTKVSNESAIAVYHDVQVSDRADAPVPTGDGGDDGGTDTDDDAGSANGVTGSGLEIVVVADPGASCDAPMAVDTKIVRISLLGKSVKTGTFDVVDIATGDLTDSTAAVEYDQDDTSCAVSTYAEATSGTVTITAIDSTHVAGSIDVKLGDDSLSGSFDAPLCSGITFAFDEEDGGGTCK